jgi:hypothetical protein
VPNLSITIRNFFIAAGRQLFWLPRRSAGVWYRAVNGGERDGVELESWGRKAPLPSPNIVIINQLELERLLGLGLSRFSRFRCCLT